MAATAADVDGTITQVIFLANGVAIPNCVAITAPYTCLWAPTAPGAYRLTAQATDNGHAMTLSPAVSVIVSTEGTGQSSQWLYMPLIMDGAP